MNFIANKIINKRWPLCCLLFLLINCDSRNPVNILTPSQSDSSNEQQNITAALDTIYSSEKLVKSGDLVMRTGRDFTSETMRNLCTWDKTYSHCGIASFENDSLFVYHAIGGEWNPNQKLRRDLFDFFCNPFENRGFGIFRYHLSSSENSEVLAAVHKYFSRGIMFDMQFDLTSDDRMYCTEFVYKAIREGCNNKIHLATTTLNHLTFVAPDNLFTNSACAEIKRVRFKR